MHIDGGSGNAGEFFNLLKNEQLKKKRSQKLVKKIFKSYLRKIDRLSLRNSFDYWKILFQKRFRDVLRDIVPAMNQFGANVVEQAPKVNYS